MARVDNEEVRRWISHYVAQLRGVEALLDGHDLARLGVAPGPVYKRILATLKDARLNGRTLTREDEAALVRKRFAAELTLQQEN
jgi:tRNA nucleotidyltransferase (CCA-adding enzyme)